MMLPRLSHRKESLLMKRIAALTTCLALLIPGAAVASAKSDSTPCSYTKTCTLSKVDHASASRSPKTTKKTATQTSSPSNATVKNASATRTASTGSLPFTGLDLGALSAGAVVLLGAGMVLRRASATDRR
jgi:hypothetical protein